MPNLDMFTTIFPAVVTVLLVISAATLFKEQKASEKMVEEILRLSIRNIAPNAKGGRASFILVDKDGKLRVQKLVTSKGVVEHDFELPLAGPAAISWSTGKETSGEVKFTGISKSAEPSGAQIRSMLAVPVIDQDKRVIGILTVDSPSPLRESGLGEKESKDKAPRVASLLAAALRNPDPRLLKSLQPEQATNK